VTTRITLEPSITSSGQRYRVFHEGHVLIENTHNPEYEACRALLAKGITGWLETYRKGTPYPAITLDIETGAKKTIIENATEGPRLASWRPFPAVAGYLKQGVEAGETNPTPMFAAA
jgi:hypothetical protein